jgi:hypothetical protein
LTERPKVKFLMVIWGARYIGEFAQVSLPSYLAEGNLPHLAERADLEVLIMTSRESRKAFNTEPIFAQLRKLCTVRYLYIDDLITSGNYGVTLTLAFARGILDSGEDQTKTTFVFMNSDFVLADGSLRSLLTKLEEGHRCIMAPSLRASTETTIDVLTSAVDPNDRILRMSPREMVRLAFDNLHPTVVGKTVTQELVTCATHNQLYWQVDENTLLARHYLIFMLAIRPERPMPPINSYCDYGFVPELVPSGQFEILDDSDDFFMLELQSATQEQNMLRGGGSTPEDVAAELSIWTTKEHRAFAEYPVVFRAGDPVGEEAAARSEFSQYYSAVKRKLTRDPIDHVNHFYWALGVKAWASTKYPEPNKTGDFPTELGDEQSLVALLSLYEAAATHRAAVRPRGAVARLKHHLRAAHLRLIDRLMATAARRPNVPLWHHMWLDYRLIFDWLQAHGPRDGKIATFVCDTLSPLRPFFADQPGFRVERLGELGTHESHAAGEELADILLIHVYRANVRETRGILEAAARRAKPGAHVAVFVEHVRGESDPSDFSRELAAYVNQILPANWVGFRISARFAGGIGRRRLRIAEQRVINYLLTSSLVRLPVMIVSSLVWPFIAAATAINNLRHWGESRTCPPYCSSFLIMLLPTASGTTAIATRTRTSPRAASAAPPGSAIEPSAVDATARLSRQLH